jgi:heme exporter protein CcmD
MKDATFIFLTYGLTIGVLVALVVVTLRRGSALARQVADQDKPWL